MMKRLLAMSSALCILAASMCATVSAEESTKTCTIPRVPGGAIHVQDTVLDDLYRNFEMQEMVEQNLTYFSGSSEATTGKFWACYDAEYLYLYIDIADTGVIDYSNENPDQTWNRESIGVMMDFDYVREDAYEYNYADNGDLVCYYNLAGDFNDVGYHMYDPESGLGLYEMIMSSSVKDTGDGHVLYEVALPFPDDVKVEEGLKFGFEVIACNAEDGARNGVVSWSPEGSEMWHYTNCCGTAILGAEIAVEAEAETPVEDGAVADTPVSAPVTADAGIVAAAAVMAVAAGVVLSKKSR